VFFATTSTVRAAVDKSQEGPFGRVLENAPLAWQWTFGYWTLPVLSLALIGIGLAVAMRSRAGLFLAASIVLPLVAYLAVSSLWFPRYLVFLTPPLAILAGAACVQVARSARAPGWAGGLMLALVLAPSLRFDWLLWNDPARAPLPEVERFQFVNGWPSGYGTRDTLAFLRQQAQMRRGGVRVVMQSGARRTFALASSVAFRYDGWVVLSDLRLDDAATPATLASWARETTTYVVVPPPHRSQRPEPGSFGPARLVLETRKPDGTLCDQVYEVCGANGCGS
jgi:hypothetical protein